MAHTSQHAGMQECIDACNRCHHICLQTAMIHCLETGGKHVEPEHFRLLINCAEICQTSANFMLGNSSHHAVICGACAQVCEACAQSCEQVGDMEECAQACRQCAQSCEQMAQASPPIGGMQRTAGSASRANA